MAHYSGTYTIELSELYARCLAKALSEKKIFPEERDKTKDSELWHKLERHTLNPRSGDAKAEKFFEKTRGKENRSIGSGASGCCTAHYAVPVMEMRESEPMFVGVAEEKVK